MATDSQSKNSITGIVLFFITLAGAFLRIYHIDANSFWNDELLTIQYVNHSIPAMVGVLWPQQMNMILYYLFCNVWLHLFVYPSEGTLRMLSAIFSIVSIPAVYFLGRTVSDDKKIASSTGLVASLLIAINAFNIQYAQDLRSYSLLFLLATLSTLLFIKAIQNPNSWKLWTAYMLVSIAGVYSHYFFTLLLFAQVVSLAAIYFGNPTGIPWKKLTISYAVVLVSVIPLFVAAYLAGPGGLTWLTKPNLGTVIYFASLMSGISGKWILLYVLAVVAGLLLGWTWIKKGMMKNWVIILFASCAFLPACLLLIESELRTPLFDPRYFIFSQPFLAVIASFGIVKILHIRGYIAKFSGALLLVLIVIFSSIGVRSYFINYKNEDWRGVANFLDANCSGENDLRLYYPVWTENFTSFYNPQLETQELDLENELENPDQKAIENLIPTNYSKICFVLRPKDTQQEVVMAALQADYPTIVPTPSFYLLDVYIYQK